MRNRCPHLAWLIALLLAAPLVGQSRPPERTPAPKAERHGGEDWPTFLGPRQDATSREVGIRTDWSKGLPIRWQMAIGEGYSMPAIVEGKVFVFDRERDQARLTCLASSTGEILWRTAYPTRYEDMYGYSGGPRTTPVVDQNRVFTYGVGGRLRAHAIDDGRLLWDVDVNRTYGVQKNFFGVGSTPVVEGDLLLVAVGGSPSDSPGIQAGTVTSNGTAVVAFDKRTGEERWRGGQELASYAAVRVADVGGHRLGLYFARGGLLGFDPANGKTTFHFPWRAKILESVNAATPVVVGDRVFLTETYGPGAVLLDLATGAPKVVWQDPRRPKSLACHWNTPVHVNGFLYGSTGRGSGDAEVRCIELATGKVRWQAPGLRRASLIHVDRHLVALGEYGELELIRVNPERYERVSAWTPVDDQGKNLLRHPAWNAPALSHGTLYVRGKDRLLALELVP